MARKPRKEITPPTQSSETSGGGVPPLPIPPDTRPEEPLPKKRTAKFVRVIDGFTVTDWI